jgi:HK97 gp10 family phage protein
MPSAIYITEKSIKEFERQCNNLIKAVHEGQTAILLAAARKIQARIKEKAPLGPPTDKKPGSLKAATYATAYPPTTSSQAVAFAGIRPRKAPHAHLVEFGHGGPQPAPPHPFFRPARDEMLPIVKEDIAKALGKTIEGAI